MDLEIAIIGIVCVALCVMPFLLVNMGRKKKEKHLFEAITDLAEQQDCKITQHEICGNYIIGIDKSKNFLFFQLSAKEQVKQKVIDLSMIKSCTISIISETIANTKIVEQLDLEFTPIDKNKPKIVLEFYNVYLSYQLINELQSIEKWNELIKKQLNEQK